MTINPCPEPFTYNSTLNLCYHLEQVTGQTRTELNNMCKSHHPNAHLVALETLEEYNFMKSYAFSAGSCFCVVTGGFTDIPGNTTEWFWEMAGTNRKKINYLPWASTQPNNSPPPEFFLIMHSSGEYHDVGDNIPSGTCCICEYDP